MSHGSKSITSFFDHSTELEWPASDAAQYQSAHMLDSRPLSSPGQQQPRAARNSSFLRLTVLSSTVLSSRAIAIIDSFDEVSIGRDRCATPRLRLKELAVSKYHANIYWDSQTEHWSLVDVGSTHGTHLIPPDSPAAQASGSISTQGYTPTQSTRLSLPKTASLPKALSHLQHIVIGGTTFVVHMHADRIPCDACTITGNNLVGLDVPIAKPEATTDREHGLTATRSLKVLKRNLLSRPLYAVSTHERAHPNNASELYVDRAELRRQRYPGWRDPKLRKESDVSQEAPSHVCVRTRAQESLRVDTMERNSGLSAATPISLNNVGHKLLLKKGWTPGSALGSHSGGEALSTGLLEPLVPQSTINRRGLGMGQKR